MKKPLQPVLRAALYRRAVACAWLTLCERQHRYKPNLSQIWGVGGRRFKSSHADQNPLEKPTSYGWFFYACRSLPVLC